MIESSYNEFLREKIFQLFNKEEALKFMEDSERPRPTVIRVNNTKIKRKELARMLISRGMEVDPLEWCPHALVVYKSPVPVGATPEYLGGYYTIQGASSLLPVLSLDPKPGDVVIDMCAAPGGKTTHIAACMENTGILYCNEINESRISSLRGNIARMGVTNAIITMMDARKILNIRVNKVLLDAPCSGTGIISRDHSIKISKSQQELKKLTKTQKELILRGFDMLKVGGKMAYSTCSVLVEENEEVVNYLLSKRPHAKLGDCVEIGRPGFVNFRGMAFDKTMSKARRVYPHVHNMDGFFIAIIERKG
ncbi:25S rRNA (cytosine-C(5))-methyltransferase nop2 [Astathelohania contejeani]|uniref:25S rRNA (Cytosine-C(5))-methyltransferase nop2 n=1 Tax=Astathelohania contejeani TaxID=164912 RepID=A0ABQ7I0T7_9MICR|nr:25S rRNA (cytosine-C(5))-methyltransferase nop2 [Thelohania contejeani]